MTNQKNKFNDPQTNSFKVYRLGERPQQAWKRFRTAIYSMSPDSRYATQILIDNRVVPRYGNRPLMTLDNAYRPYWMSFAQYQHMLTRLGLPY